MPFPDYVHSVIDSSDEAAWPVQGQWVNECGCTVAANALNLLAGWRRFDKDGFVREAGLFFQRELGGSPSPVTGWLIRRHGYGTHFGNLVRTDPEVVLRDLINRRVPAVVEIGRGQLGPIQAYGQHSILLVGYSDPHSDHAGQLHEEYYFVDSQWPELDRFMLHANDQDIDGVPTPFPGNRTMSRAEFLGAFQTRIYFPVFRSQSAHDEWYRANLRTDPGPPVVGWLGSRMLTGSYDIWVGAQHGAPILDAHAIEE